MDRWIRTAAITAAAALVVGGIAFSVTYALRGGDEVTSAQEPQDTPPEDATPAPRATPNTSLPNWDYPWFKADEAKPRFEGTLAGLRIFASHESAPEEVSALELCPPDGFELVHEHDAIAAAAHAGPVRVVASHFGPGAMFTGVPYVWQCHGITFSAFWDAYLDGGKPDVNLGGTWVAVNRFHEQDWTTVLAAPRERLEEVTVAGRPAVVMRAILEEFDAIAVAPCAAASWDPVNRVLTEVVAGTARSSVCLEVLERVLSD
jgi:hypothetical protein